MKIDRNQFTLSLYDFENFLDRTIARPESLQKTLDGRVIKVLKEMSQSLQKETEKLYAERPLFRKVCYALGKGLSDEEQAKLRCIQKIKRVKILAKTEAMKGLIARSVLGLVKSCCKASLLNEIHKELDSVKFKQFAIASLKVPHELSASQVESLSGSSSIAPISFILEHLNEFKKVSSHSQSDKQCIDKLIEGFEFNKKVSWKVLKYSHEVSSCYFWYKLSAAAHFYSILDSLKKDPVKEICFTSSPIICVEHGIRKGHAVLFAIRRHPEKDDHYYIREYNTGYGAWPTLSSVFKGMIWGTIGMFRGKNFSDEFHRSLRHTISEHLFTEESLTGDEFERVLSDDLFAFNSITDAQSSEEEFLPLYKKFKEKHAIQDPSCIAQLDIEMQVFGNCAMAAPLAYMKDRMGESLYMRFKNFVEARI